MEGGTSVLAKLKQRNGLLLVEWLVVVVIVGILVAIIAPIFYHS